MYSEDVRLGGRVSIGEKYVAEGVNLFLHLSLTSKREKDRGEVVL